MLHDLDVGVLPNLAAVQSFTAFLARHGRHLQQLKICCLDGTAEGELVAAATIAACLAVAGATGKLLGLNASGRICSSDWLVTMPSLRRLQLASKPPDSQLHVSPAISGLTALTLLSGRVTLSASTCLPASITCATLCWDLSAAFPHQASGW